MIRLLIALECVLLLIILVDGAALKSPSADDRRAAEENRNAVETAFVPRAVAGGPVPALPARDRSPVTPHDLGPGDGISEHDRAAIARNLLSLAELPRPLEASVAAPAERGEGKAVDESAARPAEQASSASPSPSTAVTTARQAGLRAVLLLTEASDNALDRGSSVRLGLLGALLRAATADPPAQLTIAPAMPPAPSPAPAIPSARENGSEQASPGRIAEAQRLLTRLGYAPGAADGVFGKRTETAIRAFQRRKGATADGEVTDQLVARLRSDVRHLAVRPPQAPPVERTGVATAGRSSPGLLASLVHGFQRLIGWDSDSVRHPAAFRAYCHTSRGEKVYCGDIARRKGAG